MNERIELAIADLQAIQTFLNAIDHFMDELSLSEFAEAGGCSSPAGVPQLSHHAQLVLRYAQERVGRAQHRLDACLPNQLAGIPTRVKAIASVDKETRSPTTALSRYSRGLRAMFAGNSALR
jgi:hypothetical protein